MWMVRSKLTSKDLKSFLTIKYDCGPQNRKALKTVLEMKHGINETWNRFEEHVSLAKRIYVEEKP